MSTVSGEVTLPAQASRIKRLVGPQSLLRRITRRRVNAIALVVLAVVVVSAITAPFVAPADPTSNNLRSIHHGPSAEFWLGTDHLGRDILSRLLYGARISIQVSFVAVGISHGIGITLGLLAGFRGGIVDEFIMRLMDGFFVIPVLILALALVAILGPSITNLMVAIGVTHIALPARLIRGSVLSVRESDFVVAARSIGASGSRIALLHVLPNSLAPLIVSATLAMGFAILIEASLSFLGVGIQPPLASWGIMLREGYGYQNLNMIEAFAPGMVIFAVVLSVNLVGDGLREALDPQLRGA